jgi:hypothetical protein
VVHALPSPPVHHPDRPPTEFFLKKFRGAYCDINDLPTLDPEVTRNLMALRQQQGDLAELALTFTIADSQYGVNTEVELKPGGAHIAVTSDNVIEYIHRWGGGQCWGAWSCRQHALLHLMAAELASLSHWEQQAVQMAWCAAWQAGFLRSSTVWVGMGRSPAACLALPAPR